MFFWTSQRKVRRLFDTERIEAAIADACRLFDARPRLVARDLHPDYASSQMAEAMGLPVVAVQHHVAHIAACMVENDLTPPALGVAWDGTGHGPDGTVWGGEFLLVTRAGWRRVAHLRHFHLPGGEAAARETVEHLIRIFGCGNVYVELQRAGAGLRTYQQIARSRLGHRACVLRARRINFYFVGQRRSEPRQRISVREHHVACPAFDDRRAGPSPGDPSSAI